MQIIQLSVCRGVVRSLDAVPKVLMPRADTTVAVTLAKGEVIKSSHVHTFTVIPLPRHSTVAVIYHFFTFEFQLNNI